MGYYNCLRLRTVFICLIIVKVCGASGGSVHRRILNATSSLEMLSKFQVSSSGEMKVLLQTDIMMTLDEYEAIYGTKETPRSRRKARRNTKRRWTNCFVNYEFVDIDRAGKEIIKEAMRHWENYTCLHFYENKNINRVQFKMGPSCCSFVGMKGGVQELFIAPKCFFTDVIVHEIGHVIGFYHEHSRPDRDDYVWIDLTNVPRCLQYNFEKFPESVINTYGVEYDYTSIMHYPDGESNAVITTIDPRYQDELGQDYGLSFKDIKLANLMYRCAIVMGCADKTCPEEGFVLYKNFLGKGRCQCWCNTGNVENPLVLCSERNFPAPKINLPSNPIRPDPVEKNIMDIWDTCETLKAMNYCTEKRIIMSQYCFHTCGYDNTSEEVCTDCYEICPMNAMSGKCFQPGYQHACNMSCGECELRDPCAIQELMFN